jgi:hypothetical protein
MGQSVATTYRKSASECRVQAARARFADNKARWLDLAEQWELVADRVAEQSIHLASDQDRASVAGRFDANIFPVAHARSILLGAASHLKVSPY